MKLTYANIIILHLIAIAAAVLCLSPATVAQDTATPLPDSLLTEEHAYRLTFTDMPLARRIVAQMRQRKLMPSHELDILEGDLLFNNGLYDQAITFYSRVLDDDSVKTDPKDRMSVLHRMISCYDSQHDDRNTTRYVELLLNEARQAGDRAMESVALFNMGKLTYYQNNKELGYSMMREAIDIMEHCDYTYKYDNLRYDYNTLLIIQQRDGRLDDALTSLQGLEQVATASTNDEPDIAGLAQKELKTLYAQKAILLYKLERFDEAEKAYRQWAEAAPDYTKDDYLMAPYLVHTGRTDEALRIYKDYEAALRAQGDTITYHMRSVLRSMGSVYMNTGRYAEAAAYYHTLAAVTDSLKVREQQSSAQELAMAYESSQKEMEIAQRTSDLKIRNAWLVGAIGAIVLLLVLFQHQWRHSRLIKKKNQALVENIQELLAYKQELEEIRQAQQQQTEQPALQQQPPEGEKEMSSYEAENQQLFLMLERKVNDGKLYLNPDLTRDDLLRIIHTDKNRLAKILQQHEYANTQAYINKKRLEHAAKDLETYPDYTINTIAEACGLPNVPTFNRLFRKRFGMTPSEFRKALQQG